MENFKTATHVKKKSGRVWPSRVPRESVSPNMLLMAYGEPQRILNAWEMSDSELRAVGILFPQSAQYIKLPVEGWLRIGPHNFEKCDMELDGHKFQYITVDGFRDASGYLIEALPDKVMIQIWSYTGIMGRAERLYTLDL